MYFNHWHSCRHCELKIAAIALWPVGRRVVSVETGKLRVKPMHVVVLNNPLIWPYAKSFAQTLYLEQRLAVLRAIFIALCGTTAFPWWLGDVKRRFR